MYHMRTYYADTAKELFMVVGSKYRRDAGPSIRAVAHMVFLKGILETLAILNPQASSLWPGRLDVSQQPDSVDITDTSATSYSFSDPLQQLWQGFVGALVLVKPWTNDFFVDIAIVYYIRVEYSVVCHILYCTISY